MDIDILIFLQNFRNGSGAILADLMQWDGKVSGDHLYFCDGDGEIVSFCIGGCHADQLAAAVEQTAAAAALTDFRCGGNDVVMIA